MSPLLSLSLALLLLLLLLLLIYTYLLSPLSAIPAAHPTAPFSPLWILLVRRARTENRTLRAAHARLGPLVRLGPRELSVSCVAGGVRAVYGGGFVKHGWYAYLADNYGVPCMFSMAEGKPHAARKRMIAHVYAKSYLQASPEMERIERVLLFERLLPLVEGWAREGRAVDVHEVNFAAAMDFITAYLFGLGKGSDFIRDAPVRRHFLELYHSRKSYTFWTQELPRLTAFLHKLGIRVVPRFVEAANKEIEAWCLGMCRGVEASLETGARTTDFDTPPVVYSQLAESLENSSTKSAPEITTHPRDLTIASEMLDHLAAGHETSGITLTFLMHELSQRPELQATLREELLTLSPAISYPTSKENQEQKLDLPELPSPRALDALPLLHALLLETLRLHAAIPGPQPRVTPSIPTTLAGYSDIPPNTRVSALTYTLHQNAAVFPDPLAWKPERWLEAGKEEKEEMMRWFWAFGSGGRMCIGSNFAMQGEFAISFQKCVWLWLRGAMESLLMALCNRVEMKFLLAAIYTNYTTSIVDDEGIEQEDAYTAGPVGNKLVLKFARVKEGTS
ncbi:hypothetical protein MMC11_002415 [Xylographa trunciseda]|nr:hypothetical protein [Xylographa trunciseda]